MKQTSFLLLIIAINWSCSRPVDQAVLKSEIEKANDEFAKALKETNVDALVACYTDDARLMFPHMPALTGKEQIKGFFEQGIRDGISGIKLTTEELQGTGDMVIELGRYELMAGDQKIDEGKYLAAWKKVNGKWLLHYDMPSSDMPLPQPVAQAEEPVDSQ
jgi:ketosteroid isomerase-like protein